MRKTKRPAVWGRVTGTTPGHSTRSAAIPRYGPARPPARVQMCTSILALDTDFVAAPGTVDHALAATPAIRKIDRIPSDPSKNGFGMRPPFDGVRWSSYFRGGLTHARASVLCYRRRHDPAFERSHPISRPAITNIANFVVKTDNLDAARKFYSGVLGYDEVFRHKRAVSGPAELAVFKVNDRQYIEVCPDARKSHRTTS